MYVEYNYMKNIFSGKHLFSRICLLLVLTFSTTEGSSWSQSYKLKQQVSGAVVTNAAGCAEIGRDIMAQGGNIIDTAIATAFCEGVMKPTTMGLGGGFIATIFDKASGKVFAFNAREMAPAAATENMFNGNKTLSVTGGLAVAVPSELKGYWQLYNQYGGKVSWWKLIDPSIRLCRNGIPMNNFTNKFVKQRETFVRADPGLKAIFINPETDEVYEVGQLYKRPKLANTLRIIAKEGGLALHKGSLSKNFVKDIQDQGGIITEKDLRNYKPEIINPVTTKVAQKDVYSFPLPGSGALVIYMLNILENYVNFTNPVSILNLQRLTETLKFAYAERSKLGDRHFVEGVDAVLINRLYYNFNIQQSSDNKRIHHQLQPMNLYLDDDWLLQNEDIVTQLIEYGHNVSYISPDGFSAITTISVDNSSEYQITAVFDKRRPGSLAYFKENNLIKKQKISGEVTFISYLSIYFPC